jgi:fatty acid desaturase
MRATQTPRHDPWWEVDGPAARRERRRRRVMSTAAFLASVVAAGLSAAAWAAQLGLPRLFGLEVAQLVG